MDEITALQAEILKTLASPRRLEILHRLAEGPNDLGPGFAFGERRQPVLQMFQRRRHLNAHNIGTRRQHLAELDIGRPQLFQRAPQPGSGIGPVAAECLKRTDQGQRCPKQPQETADIAHQRRQAECMAAMPPDRLRTFT